MSEYSRRQFLQHATTGLAASSVFSTPFVSWGQHKGERPKPSLKVVSVANPRNRVPLSFIIDDSTALVNMAYFGIPQFGHVFPERYKQPWRSLPREIPDSFVRKFGEWCHENGVKGKYSMVPYPACVGWLDRELPGWSKQELDQSLDLVRTLMLPDWDIHPEMVSHTRVIDTKTGRPHEEYTADYMENWEWTTGRSVDEIANYLSYALKILKNVDLPCEGITTPGGFGNKALPELAQATLESCRDVFNAEIPHYFRHLYTDDTSVAPRVEYAADLDTDHPRCVVSLIGCTGDWFGGWDGLTPGSVDRLIGADLDAGRLPEVIRRGEPAIMVCHWPGIYFNGEELGFNIFKTAVQRLHQGYDNLIWLKLSEIARYWAARELTGISFKDNRILLKAPFACPDFTLQMAGMDKTGFNVIYQGKSHSLFRQEDPKKISSGQWSQAGNQTLICFQLMKGETELKFQST
jgi:hypothetical protein